MGTYLSITATKNNSPSGIIDLENVRKSALLSFGSRLANLARFSSRRHSLCQNKRFDNYRKCNLIAMAARTHPSRRSPSSADWSSGKHLVTCSACKPLLDPVQNTGTIQPKNSCDTSHA